MGRVAVAMGSELQRLWGLKVSLVLALVQQTRIWVLDLDLEQAKQRTI